jgi:hypothetical protein
MKEISLNDIHEAFITLENQSKTRESVADWAIDLRSEYDKGTLLFVPEGEKKKILDAILWLSGVDLKDISDPYFHTIEDIVDYRKERKL